MVRVVPLTPVAEKKRTFLRGAGAGPTTLSHWSTYKAQACLSDLTLMCRRIGPSLRAREAGHVVPRRHSDPPSRGELGTVPDRPVPLGSAAGAAARGSSREGYDSSGSTNATRSATISV